MLYHLMPHIKQTSKYLVFIIFSLFINISIIVYDHLSYCFLSFKFIVILCRYNLVFTPFTGMDNHGKCVVFGAGLLNKEDVESYVWVLEKFKSCTKNDPTMLITDQDPALKIAVPQVFPHTRHRFCMWHIMEKVSVKIPQHLKNNEHFRPALNALVWSEMIEPDEFEEQWENMVTEFGLVGDNWFNSMYDVRHSWIPAYFRDFPMSGLLKTTSISESGNSYFKIYMNSRANLLEFFMHFESALDSQRHEHDRLSSVDESTFPKLKSPYSFEKQAACVYTNKIFKDMQDEIWRASYRCHISNMNVEVGVSRYEILHKGGVFNVMYNTEDGTITCSCKKFIRLGLLCCHSFHVLQNLDIQSINEKYLVARWTKYACPKSLNDLHSDIGEQPICLDENRELGNQCHSEFYHTFGISGANTNRLKVFLRGLRELKEIVKSVDGSASNMLEKDKIFEHYYGASIPENVSVLAPDTVKNKGSGRRIKPARENAIESARKSLRNCSKCKKLTNHDARNCEKKS